MVKNIKSNSPIFPTFYILMCRMHRGKIYSIMKNDDICASCGKLKS
jgi:hypothetical protein